MTEMDEFMQQVHDVCNSIAPMLAGRPPDVQSAALADLTATWLFGHQLRDPPPGEIEELRTQLMDNFVRLVNALVEVYDDKHKKSLQ